MEREKGEREGQTYKGGRRGGGKRKREGLGCEVVKGKMWMNGGERKRRNGKKRDDIERGSKSGESGGRGEGGGGETGR